jgi:hypothetical protein
MKIFLAVLAAALVAAPAALADGGPFLAMQGGSGIPSADGKSTYVAVPTLNDSTLVETIGKDGSLWSWPEFVGSYGIPTITFNQPTGLSRDGRTLVLQSTTFGSPTDFLVMNTRTGRARDLFVLNGYYSFDALSPDASKLYLVQHVDMNNTSRYVVRAYDLRTHRLLPGRIADRTQKSWVMQGDPVTRATTPDGRWVYTLYQNYGGYPFIHALDTVRGVAHCIGLPWRSPNQSAMTNVVLSLHGSRLAIAWRSGRPWLNMNTTTWRLTAVHRGFPWLWLALGILPLAGIVELLRRRRRNTPVSVEGGFHGSPARVRSRLPRRPRVGTGGVRRLPRPIRAAGRPGRALARRRAALHGVEGRHEHVAQGGQPH